MRQIILSEVLVNAILQYLGKQTYNDVAGLIQAIAQSKDAEITAQVRNLPKEEEKTDG
jgi:hypothetical protein